MRSVGRCRPVDKCVVRLKASVRVASPRLWERASRRLCWPLTRTVLTSALAPLPAGPLWFACCVAQLRTGMAPVRTTSTAVRDGSVTLVDAATVPVPVVMEQSPLDDRRYQHVTLPNGLRVLLVADDAAETAAACFTVAVGRTAPPRPAASFASCQLSRCGRCACRGASSRVGPPTAPTRWASSPTGSITRVPALSCLPSRRGGGCPRCGRAH